MIQASNCTRNRRVRSRAAIAVFWSLVVIMLLTACEEELSPSNSTADSTTAISPPSELAATPTQADKVRASATASAVWIADNWSKSESVAYEELFRNIDLYEGKSFRFGGKVIQVLDADDDRYQMRISITRDRSSWSNPVLVLHTGIRILEGDFVQFVGKVMGTITYETIFGGDVTIPELKADQLQVVDEDSLTSRANVESELTGATPSPAAADPNTDSSPVAEPAASSIVDGSWRVGVDVDPGIYLTQGSDRCYWQRLSGFSGEFSELIANDSPEGRSIVEILPSDVGFDSSRCGEWIPVDELDLFEPAITFGDGVWRVGTDIEPGRYSTLGSDRCYWQRLSGFSGDFSELIANESPEGRSVVEILPSDVGFDSARCGEWVRVSEVQSQEPATTFGDGVWQVGIDIEPGTYSTLGSDRCYWQRLSGFSGNFSDLLANDSPEGRSIVEILPTDIGFDSARCGEWTVLDKSTP